MFNVQAIYPLLHGKVPAHGLCRQILIYARFLVDLITTTRTLLLLKCSRATCKCTLPPRPHPKCREPNQLAQKAFRTHKKEKENERQAQPFLGARTKRKLEDRDSSNWPPATRQEAEVDVETKMKMNLTKLHII